MSKYTKEELLRHVKTHTERSNDDRAAVTVLESFLRSNGEINHSFSYNDKEPNIDGRFELVPFPELSRRPKQSFVVQIKGTQNFAVNTEGHVKYQLKSLAFPAYIGVEVTLDPGILFVVFNAHKRGEEKVFWKYISPEFLSSIDFNNQSMTIEFCKEDEILYTEDSVKEFIKRLDMIAERHSFMKTLEPREYKVEDVKRVIQRRCQDISEEIDRFEIYNDTRDNVSRKIITQLRDLCEATLVLNGLNYYQQISLRTSWELALMSLSTKFLSTFLQGLRYIAFRVPEDGQYERLMLKYYDFLWRIRKYLRDNHKIDVLENLEKFPRELDEEDKAYSQLIANAFKSVKSEFNPVKQSRYYIEKQTTFYVGKERYFEVTLQLADKYATKYNRLTVYTQKDISTNYAIQVGYEEISIQLWDKPSLIKIVTNWQVSIDPAALNKIAFIIGKDLKLSARYNEYHALMKFLTQSGVNLLDLIDMRQERFDAILEHIYSKQKTKYFKEILLTLKNDFDENAHTWGKNIVRYLLLKLKDEVLEDLLLQEGNKGYFNKNIKLSSSCSPFGNNPILYNLPNQKTHNQKVSKDVIRAVALKNIDKYLPYIRLKSLINLTGEIYFPKEEIEYNEEAQTINGYNTLLANYDKEQGYELEEENDYVCIKGYVEDTVFILQSLIDLTRKGNDGQKPLNQRFVKRLDNEEIDEIKRIALEKVFLDSQVLTIYGAAGTGKTTLMDYLSNLMEGRSKLFLTKTHTALENLKRRIKAPGQNSCFVGVDKFLKTKNVPNYDLIFIDECSTIDNRTMKQLLEKFDKESLFVLAGDIYQIESIDFGNWFFYAKEILPEKARVELNSTWRTKDPALKDLWEEVRFKKPLIIEKLVIDGPFSENIGQSIFDKTDEDEVVLCLNYDGRYGLNNINSYFQDANPSTAVYRWREWRYKIGDRILFNESRRFPQLYNNLKGEIIDIEQDENTITFVVEVQTVITAVDARNADFEILDWTDNDTTIIKFFVTNNVGASTEEERELARMRAIVPFQLAYAVSIHKAQGLEYNSVKIVIPSSNAEKISHGVFYTAITRAKQKLKIFWSSDTMQQVISRFKEDDVEQKSLKLIKQKMGIK